MHLGSIIVIIIILISSVNMVGDMQQILLNKTKQKILNVFFLIKRKKTRKLLGCGGGRWVMNKMGLEDNLLTLFVMYFKTNINFQIIKFQILK